jgi:hypothetical protein
MDELPHRYECLHGHMAAYVDDDMDDEVGILAHLWTAQHQRWTIF